MKIEVNCHNWFYDGWAACLFGLPREHPWSGSANPEEVKSFAAGWDTCHETGPAEAYRVFADEVRAGHLSVSWQ